MKSEELKIEDVNKEVLSDEKKIELRNDEIEEIMGSPPSSMVRVGSGSLLIIIIFLIAGSTLFPSIDRVHTRVILDGVMPLWVATAPETGDIEKALPFGESFINEGDTMAFLYLYENRTLPIIAEYSGILESNPLFYIKHHIEARDTIAFIWPAERDTVACIVNLTYNDGKHVRVGNKVRIVLDDYPVEEYGMFETTIKFIGHFNNDYVAYASLPEDMLTTNQQFLNLRGKNYASVEIITNEQTLFNRLLNPFKGLIKH